MTSIDRFYNTTFTVKRMVWANESSAEVSVDTFLGHIQQADPEFAQFIGEAWGKTFSAWCPIDTDVDTGDTIEITDDNYGGTYNVKNIQTNATGANQHLELTLIRDIE